MKVLSIIAAICLLGFFAYRTLIGGSTESWHQRLTIIIDTPTGEVRGSSVVEITNIETMGPLVLMEARGVHTKVRGEAVAVEVVLGRWLFALLESPSNSQGNVDQLAHAAFDLGGGRPARERSYANNIADLREVPLDEPAPLPRDSYPMLVTFDDISDPITVRQVDPDDLDATFGCDHVTNGSLYPWRSQGLFYRRWAEQEVSRLSREQASGRAGLTGPVGDAINEVFEITDGDVSDVEALRLVELRKGFTRGQREEWEHARYELMQEPPATLPSPQSLGKAQGGPCHQLTSLVLEITKEDVTEGRVAGVLGWLCGHKTEPNLSWTNGQTEKNTLARYLNTGYFSVGSCK
jgi:hypothetical protein